MLPSAQETTSVEKIFNNLGSGFLLYFAFFSKYKDVDAFLLSILIMTIN